MGLYYAAVFSFLAFSRKTPADNRMYQVIMGAKASFCKMAINAMHPIRNTYCTELLCQESSVSFSENIGRGDIRSREKSKIKANSIHGF